MGFLSLLMTVEISHCLMSQSISMFDCSTRIDAAKDVDLEGDADDDNDDELPPTVTDDPRKVATATTHCADAGDALAMNSPPPPSPPLRTPEDDEAGTS